MIKKYSRCMFNILRNFQAVSNVVIHFTFPPAMYEGSSYSVFANTESLEF